MEEIRRLQQEFQSAQLCGSALRLSERNCIEIVNWIKSQSLLKVFFTLDGKEFITFEQLEKEVRDELFVSKGRLALSNIVDSLNVDLSHIEEVAYEIVKQDADILYIQGELLDAAYLDSCAQEVNEKLQEFGKVTVSELCNTFSLPIEIIQKSIQDRIGALIHGFLDPNSRGTLYTHAFLTRHAAKVRGIFSALTRPALVSHLVAAHSLQEDCVPSLLRELVGARRIRGCFTGGEFHASFVPDIYHKTQDQWAQSFLRQNHYLDFDTLKRIQVADPKHYIASKFRSEGILLHSCFLSSHLVDQMEASLDETLRLDSWMDLLAFLPSSCDLQDCLRFVNHSSLISSKVKNAAALVFSDRFIVSKSFLNSLFQLFDQEIISKANLSLSAPNLPQSHPQNHTSPASSSPVDPPQNGPFVKGKKSSSSSDRKKNSSKDAQNSSASSPPSANSPAANSKSKKHQSKSKNSSGNQPQNSTTTTTAPTAAKGLFSSAEVANILKKKIGSAAENHQDKHSNEFCPDKLIEDLGKHLLKNLNASLQEAIQSVYVSGSATNKRLHQELQELISSLWFNIQLFWKGIQTLAEANQAIDAAPFEKYLLKTHCDDLFELILKQVAADHLLPINTASSTLSEKLAPQQRAAILDSVSSSAAFQKVNSLLLKGKSVLEFSQEIENVAASCQFLLKKIDKKLERQIIFNHRHALISKLNHEKNPPLALHLTVLLLFQSATKAILHAPGRCVPSLIQFLASVLPEPHHALLVQYQNAAIKSLSSSLISTDAKDENDENEQLSDSLHAEKENASQGDIHSFLTEKLPLLKQLVIPENQNQIQQTPS